MKYVTILLLIFISLCAYAQNDSLVFKNETLWWVK